MTVTSLKEWKAVAAAHQGTTLALAEFIAALKPEHIPGHTRRIITKALIDAIGCGLYGLTTPWGQMLNAFALEQGGHAGVSGVKAATVSDTPGRLFGFPILSRIED